MGKEEEEPTIEELLVRFKSGDYRILFKIYSEE